MLKWYGFLNEHDEKIQEMILWLSEDENYNGLTTIDELLNEMNAPDKRIIFIDKSISPNFYSLTMQLKKLHPNNFVILVGKDLKEADIRLAMRAGMMDCINLQDDIELIKSCLLESKRHINHIHKQDTFVPSFTHKEGKIITVSSTKGGVGKTTFAVNLAYSLQKEEQSVVIVDLHLQFGDVSMFCDVKPKKTIYEWVKEDFDRKNRNVQAYLTKTYVENVSIIAAPLRPEFSEIITTEHIRELFLELKRWYDIILVDTHSHVDDLFLETLELSDEIYVLSTGNLPAIRNTKLFIDTLHSLQLKATPLIVLNDVKKDDPLKEENVKKILGLNKLAVLPSDEKIVKKSIASGVPFVADSPKSALSKMYLKIAEACIQKHASYKAEPVASAGRSK
ncbi:Septum site-determining protein MinD [Bacillus sp. THAF10]|uniref:AAA family ATPase n=1 Tax=Bacillus sp. THAF10 TaxID=2587848 RepID=UPI0012A7E670|nr:AAA family ATPase [Bacillus sp. THAF10]QFT88469.1 Septum site-determining protein MinD [Bacillus sp. THAF10]